MTRHFVLVDYENVQPKGLGALAAEHAEVRVFAGAAQHKIDLALAQALQPFGARAEYVQINGSGKNALDFHIAFHLGELSARHPDAQFTIVSKDTGFDPLVKHLNSRGIHCRRTATLGGGTPAKPAPDKATAGPAAQSRPASPKPTATDAGKAQPAKAAAAKPQLAKAEAETAAPTKTTAVKPQPTKAATKAPAATKQAKVPPPAREQVLNWLASIPTSRPRTRKTLVSSIKALLKPAATDEAVSALIADLVAAGVLTISEHGKVGYRG
jgi:hypothetical protein